MLYNFLCACFILGIAMVLFYTPYLYVTGLLKLSYGSIERGDKAKSAIPVVNLFTGERAYFGKVSLPGIMILVTTIVALVKFIAFFVAPYELLHTVLAILIGLGVLLTVAASAFNMWRVLTDANIISLPMRLFLTLFYPFGQWYVGTVLPQALAYYSQSEDTF